MKAKTLILFTCIFSATAYGQGCAPKMVLIEKDDATDCAPCLASVEHIKSFYQQHKDSIAYVYYPDYPIGRQFSETDATEWTTYCGRESEFNSGYVADVYVDRTYFQNNQINPSGPNYSEAVANFETAYQQQITSATVPVIVSINHTYNPVTREVSVNITGEFCEQSYGDLRFFLVAVQDTVIGDGDEYGQLCLGTANANEFGYQSTASGVSYIHHYPHTQVAVYQPSCIYGNGGIMGGIINPGEVYTENYTFHLPDSTWLPDLEGISTNEAYAMYGVPHAIIPERIELIAAVVRNGDYMYREALNATKIKLINGNTTEVQVPNPENSGVFTIVENPVSKDQLVINWKSHKELTGDVIVFNSVGENIRVLDKNLFINTTPQQKAYNVSDLSKGVYFIGYRSNGIQYSQKFIIQ